MTSTERNTMLNALPVPILLDIAILFTALSWGLGFYIVDKRAYVYFACHWLFCVPARVQCRKLGCAHLGCSCRSDSHRRAAALVCLKKATKNGRGLRFDLGNLHRYPHAPECFTSLRLIDSRLET